ncbi:hypothetical protein SynBOUM118_00789 [Synechococcus sp. BOUM118]|nr:hypothetical protein SynBOUM118_00789 [Synechococcus sp. BOUM118]
MSKGAITHQAERPTVWSTNPLTPVSLISLDPGLTRSSPAAEMP